MKTTQLFAIGLLSLWAFAAPSAFSADRMEVNERLVAVDRATGASQIFPAHAGYHYEYVSSANGHALIRVFDPAGSEIQGEFLVDEASLPNSLKTSITAGLKAARKGAQNEPGCCDVVETAPEPRPEKVSRGPAIAPGTKIVYADPAELKAAPARMPARAPAITKPRDVTLCQSFDHFKNLGVNADALRQALFFYQQAKQNRTLASTSKVIAIADYSQNSRKKRFYLLNLETGELKTEKVSHGGGNRQSGNPGDPNHDGMLDRCGGSRSGMTRAGFFATENYYVQGSGRFRWPALTRRPFRNGVRLKGLTPGVNDDAQDDGVVMHEAKYNFDGNIPMGRSHGCPAFVPGHGGPVFAKMTADHSLLYSYAPVCRAQMDKVYRQIRGWQNFCK